MKIKRYNNFINESLRDKLKGKSKEEVDKALNNYLDNLEKDLSNIKPRELVHTLGIIHKDYKDIINTLIDVDVVSTMWVLDEIINNMDEDWNDDVEKKKLDIFNYIKNNKDKIDTSRI